MIYTKEEQKANRKKWIEALRSGKYKQIKQKLRDKDGFCCLGVACELAVDAHVIEPPTCNEYGIYFYDNCSLDLSPKVIKWLGLSDSEGRFKTKYNFSRLSYENDTDHTFAEIADIIESEPEGLLEEEECK